MSIIINIHARQILDSRGNPTVEVDVTTENGVVVELQYHQERQQENMKQLNLEMVEMPIWEKELQKL